MPALKHPVGTRFGRLVITERVGRIALCRCDCGTEVRVLISSLCNQKTKSCGCYHSDYHRQRWLRHGQTHTPTYRSWSNMISRCTQKCQKGYHNYGGRGITVCDRWLTFENFLADMGERPEGTSIERKNNDGNYTPENCIWATDDVQNRNKRSNRFLSYQGRVMCLGDWADEIGIHRVTLTNRLKRMTVEEALSLPQYYNRAEASVCHSTIPDAHQR